MLFWMIVKVAFKSLLANKMRTVLAMLGIIIGVAAVISMLAIGSGAQQFVLGRITAMGANLLIVRPGQRGSGGVMSGTQQNLTLEDAQAIVKVPGVHAVAPTVSGMAQIKYLSQNTRSNVLGTAVTYLPMRNFEVERGKMFSDDEGEHGARVCVIGPVTATNLFGVSDPLGQNIKISTPATAITFRVVGVLKSKGDQGWFNPDDQVIVPFGIAMHELLGRTNVGEIDIDANPGTNLTSLQDDIMQELRKRHKIQPGFPDDVQIQNQAEIQSTVGDSIMAFNLLLGSVAGISLLVGGIGIMNIMLVTVTERTREIGIRKAIGARNFDILSQFLIEAVLMSGLGGMAGVGVGIAVAALVKKYSRFPSVVELYSILLALGFSAAVGIFFGFYPATRAAKLDPIEALRYE